ncbi:MULTISPECIES: ISAs1 family transposase [Burkholderia]|nr:MULTISPECIES: ISAs1 family transposase [Burkholderia]
MSALGREWAGIKRLVMVESTPHIGEKLTTEQRYYISSKPAKAAEMMQLIRAHWGIENQLHWVLDVSWGEDACLIRDKIAARNMATLRKMTLNLARLAQQQQPKKVSLKNIRNLAAWDPDLRSSILGLQ